MPEAETYERLREKISSWPIRVPRTREVMEMLRILFTEEEAGFLIHFEAPYQDRKTMDQRARQALARVEAERIH